MGTNLDSQKSHVILEKYLWDDDPLDKDANFKRDVVLYTKEDPMPTVSRLSRNLDIPEGAVIRYVLCKWAASGSDALLETGSNMVNKMSDILEQAEQYDTSHARLEAYQSLRKIVSWLRVPLDNPDYRNV
ncbi:MAG: hypothetical protein CL742_08520 [Chloroflexi bacterium]|nr:hypothetical protein [Chloroflexota bacterium]MQG01125.1 hypothetical protein [SAR202 cluster bacterium]